MGRRRAAGRGGSGRGTGDVSAASKRSAAAMGYTADRFLLRLLPGGGPRRAPAVHRGYYVRARAVELCVRAFLLGTRGGPPRRQVVSVGAGLDTLYFGLKSEGLLAGADFFEVDLPDVAGRKAELVGGAAELAALTGSRAAGEEGMTKFSGEDYKLLGVDLSDLPMLEKALHCSGLDSRVPTLIIAEVVLTYMEVERSDALIQWAAGHFGKAWFVLYEQIHPSDPFGRIMQNHFSRLKSPLRSLSLYPDCRAQQRRFCQRGWTSCGIMDMNEFYSCFVPKEEQKRIQALEPFDEFEEWHLKCSHYFILVASKGEGLPAAPVFSRTEAQLTQRGPHFAGAVAASPCMTGRVAAGLRRYGHCSVLLAPNLILTTGGFGDQAGRHCRLTELHVLFRHQDAWQTDHESLARLGTTWDGRLFHTVTLLSTGWAITVGGRRAPADPAMEILRFRALRNAASLSPGGPVLELLQLPPAEGPVLPRWRHTATEVMYEGQAYLFIYGGCGSGQSGRADWGFLHVEELFCQKIPVEGPIPSGRHSHSASSWEGGVLIAGGLGANEQPLGSVLFLRPAASSFQWCSFDTCPPLTPRYSHTAHVHRGKLLLVGGVWFAAPSVPGVAVIDLETRVVTEYCVDTTGLEWPLLLHNHSSLFVPDREELLLIGGGGNCFSFGTHLNWSPVCLDLGSIWRAEPGRLAVQEACQGEDQ